MDLSVQQALQLLYGSSEVPVCAVDRRLDLIWASDSRCRTLLSWLRKELPASVSSPGVILPPDGTVLFDIREDQPAACQIQRLTVSGEELFLLRFPEHSERRELTPQESRAMLRSHTDICRSAVASVMQTLYFAENDLRNGRAPDLREVIYDAEEPCYTIMDSCQHCEELLWYTYHSQDEVQEIQDLTITLRQFAEKLTRLTGSSLKLTDCRIERGLYVKIDPERFAYVLILMFLSTHGGVPERNEMTLQAEERDGRVRIRMAFSKGRKRKSLFHLPLSRDISLANSASLLERFCRIFSAEIIRGDDPEKPECTLILPEAAPDYGFLPLSSLQNPYDEGSFGLLHVMLSEIIHPADFPHVF
ncbi:MAG: hypothetical protein IJ060_00500 [Oscillospiraceae bacterium]|nr:hypothetical protein [Oscillospiraceae bacterium]